MSRLSLCTLDDQHNQGKFVPAASTSLQNRCTPCSAQSDLPQLESVPGDNWGPGASGNRQTEMGKIGNLCTFLYGPLMPRSGGSFFSERRRLRCPITIFLAFDQF